MFKIKNKGYLICIQAILVTEVFMSNIGIGAPIPLYGNDRNEFSVGKYEDGLFDLPDDAVLKKKTTVNSKEEALSFAKNNPGAEFVVERGDVNKGMSYDVYSLTIKDKGKGIHKLQDAKNLQLFERTLKIVEKNTGTSNSVRGYIIAESGEVGKPIYNNRFSQTNFDKFREKLSLDGSKLWFKIVDKGMGMGGGPDDMPVISDKELKSLGSKAKKGDIILCGIDGSFIHGILYVGKDKEIQNKLEKQWGMPQGSLDNETMIMHSLQSDSDTPGVIDGKEQTFKSGGVGVIMDTLERYTQRHGRDVMLLTQIKGTTEEDRNAMVETGKKFVGKDYDAAFNTFDDTDMYCTEFIMKVALSSSHPPDLKLQKNPLLPYPKFMIDLAPEKLKKALKEDGFLHQEMIMTDGIAASPSMDIVWASKNADKSEFFKKHERWADGMEGKVNPEYKTMLLKNVPDEAAKSRDITNKIKELAGKTRDEIQE